MKECIETIILALDHKLISLDEAKAYTKQMLEESFDDGKN